MFAELYARGEKSSALRQVFQSPESVLPEGKDYDFADALVWGNVYDFKQTSSFMPDGEVFAFDRYLATLLVHRDESYRHIRETGVLPPLPWLECLLSYRDGKTLTDIQAGSLLPFSREDFHKQVRFYQRNLAFKGLRPRLCQCLEYPQLNPSLISYFPLSYASTCLDLSDLSGIPVLFMEPYDVDWGLLLKDLEGKPAIFAFPDSIHLGHCLALDGVLEVLSDKKHGVFVYNSYPNGQMLAQPQLSRLATDLRPVYCGSPELVRQHGDALVARLQACLTQSLVEKKSDSVLGDELYSLGLSLQQHLRFQRLGPSRSLAWHRRVQLMNWFEPHKQRLHLQPPEGIRSDFIGETLAGMARSEPCRAPRSERIRICHVMPQLVDHGNSPSRIIRAFLRAHDHTKYDIYLLITDVNTPKPEEYPCCINVSQGSLERGRESLDALAELGITMSVIGQAGSYEKTAELTQDFLRQHEIDAAIFHEADVVNLSVAQSCDVPCKAFFMHSEGLKYPGFDLYVCGDEEYAKDYQERGLGARVEIIPFALDVRENWDSEPATKAELGFTADSQLMVTVSNHFEHRMTTEFCKAVSDILDAVPNSYYILVGRFNTPFEPLKEARFPKKHWDRIFSYGVHPCPSHLMRSMDLYLNEFPDGGGFAVLDAMAAGLPVVSMYDEAGTQLRRVGGGFFGKERAVCNLEPQDYVDLAVRLLSDETKRSRWTAYAQERYVSIVHVERDVRQIEAALAETLQGKVPAGPSSAHQ